MSTTTNYAFGRGTLFVDGKFVGRSANIKLDMIYKGLGGPPDVEVHVIIDDPTMPEPPRCAHGIVEGCLQCRT